MCDNHDHDRKDSDKIYESEVVELRVVYKFDNGYGASVVMTEHSYGGSEGLLEVAVLRGDDLCYDTPITNDVIGYLPKSELTSLLVKIKNLEPA